MPSSTIGAQSIEKQDFSCVINKIECQYTTDDKEKNATLFERTKSNNTSVKEVSPQNKIIAKDGVFYAKISYQEGPEYYFITNYEGKVVKLSCLREVNLCSNKKHQQYVIEYVDIEDKNLKSETKDINDGIIRLYYFNLFYRKAEYAKNLKNVTEKNKIVLEPPISRKMAGIAGSAIGAMAGSTIDFICALRFIHLPTIKSNDNQYECHTLLKFKECPHKKSVPHIVIYTYPDIEFSLELGYCGISNKYYANSEKKDTREQTTYSFSFTVKYASIEKEFSYKQFEEQELDTETQKGALFYKTIVFLSDFFKDAAQLTKQLKEKINDVYGENDNLLKNDLVVVGNTFGALGTAKKWIEGSLEIKPSLKAKWRYSVSDDLSKLGKYFELELGVDCTGKITIDLIQLSILCLKKTKTYTKVAAIAASVSTGFLASIPSLLIQSLVEVVANWLIKKFKEGVKFNFILKGGVNVKSCSLKWDTSRDKIFEGDGLALEIKPEIILEIGLEYITSKELKVFVKRAESSNSTNISNAPKLKGEISASAEAASALTWKLDFNVKEGVFGADNEVTINPFELKIEYKVSGSFEIFGYSFTGSNKSRVYEWKSREYNKKLNRLKWFKLYDVQPTTSEELRNGCSSW